MTREQWQAAKDIRRIGKNVVAAKSVRRRNAQAQPQEELQGLEVLQRIAQAQAQKLQGLEGLLDLGVNMGLY